MRVVVLGAGYAGCVAVQTLERHLASAEHTWISGPELHLVRFEVHRVVRDPAAREQLTIPVDAIEADSTRFVRGRVTGLDVEDRFVELTSGEHVPEDYALATQGSQTANYGIPGPVERAHAVGDAALVGLDGATAPPTARASRDVAEVAVENVVRSLEGRSLRRWAEEDRGSLALEDESVIACAVSVLPMVVVGETPAVLVEKLVAAHWITSIASWSGALTAWDAR